MSDSKFTLSKEADFLWDYFSIAGASLVTNEQFYSLYRLDFSIVGFTNVFVHINLAVHVTTSQDDLDALKLFFNGVQRGVCFKGIYIELDPAIVDTGAEVVALGAAINFYFDKSRELERSVGIRLSTDCSIHYFSIEESIDRLQRASNDQDLAIGDFFKGRITHYFVDRGFGFIQTSNDRKFFLHIANIVDDNLRASLANYSLGHTIPVEFQFGGSSGGKYPKAINVVIDESDSYYS